MSNENKQEELSPANQLREALAKLPGAPTPEVIEGWKATYGDVYVAAFSESEIFLFRSLSRKEYGVLQDKAGAGQLDSSGYEESAVNTCLLYKSDDLERKAGTVASLLEMIMQNSNFVPPQVAAQLVAKL